MPPPKQLSKPHSKASIVIASLLFLVWCLMVKRKVAFGGVELVSQPPWRSEQTGTSTAFALPGPEGSKSVQKGVTEHALVVGPTLQPKLFQLQRDSRFRCLRKW
ncbi:protein pleiotropic regulatory locus 1-like isoform X3 [Brassica napus]|uniref:protein pleiotropic regulatory locus 1-like isoform X3 n=1 Tax=Brassica napus TaxID=3708 RepID=UPI002079D6B6|nr:protein pleiotropic regulatory locus 1-like isoform X3 [Brassica napus]